MVKVLAINMQSSMNILRYISVAVSSLVLLSCTGNVDDSSLPVLEVSDSEIDLATETQAVFTVTYDGVDVTSESEISSSPETVLGSGTMCSHRPWRGT